MKKYQGVDFLGFDELLSEEELMVRQTVREFVDERFDFGTQIWLIVE